MEVLLTEDEETDVLSEVDLLHREIDELKMRLVGAEAMVLFYRDRLNEMEYRLGPAAHEER